jgi:hypothetical protein
MKKGDDQVFHATSSTGGNISYSITSGNLPYGVTFSDNGHLDYTDDATLSENVQLTIEAISDKGGHNSIKIALLSPATPVLTANILDNNLKIGTTGTATLSVTEINVDSWETPSVSFNTASTSFAVSNFTPGSGLTRTATISLGTPSPAASSYDATITIPGASSITQTLSVATAKALKIIFPSADPVGGEFNRTAEFGSHVDVDNFNVQDENGKNLPIYTGSGAAPTNTVKITGL